MIAYLFKDSCYSNPFISSNNSANSKSTNGIKVAQTSPHTVSGLSPNSLTKNFTSTSQKQGTTLDPKQTGISITNETPKKGMLWGVRDLMRSGSNFLGFSGSSFLTPNEKNAIKSNQEIQELKKELKDLNREAIKELNQTGTKNYNTYDSQIAQKETELKNAIDKIITEYRNKKLGKQKL